MKRLKTLVNLFVKGEISSERKSYLSLSASLFKHNSKRPSERSFFRRFSCFLRRELSHRHPQLTSVINISKLLILAIIVGKEVGKELPILAYTISMRYCSEVFMGRSYVG
jgi:hypothetical protein